MAARMNNQYEERLGTERMLPLIFKMALPAVAAQFVNLLYNIVDRIYIGHIPEIGTNALAGVGVTTSIVILISSFSAIVGAGGAPLAAMALGQGDRVRAGKFLGNGFMLLILFTVLTSLVSYLFMEPILRFAGASAVTLPYAEDYLSVYLLGTLFVEISTGLNTFINSQGRPNIAMYSVLIGALLNIVLDPIFIFWFDMGVKGAALATILSQACSAWWVLGFLCSDRASLRLQKCYLKFDCRIVGGMLALGVSPFIMASTESLVGFVLNGSLEKFGDIYVGALAILQSAMQLVSVPLTGFAQGFVPVASYNYGHGDRQRVKDCFRIVLTVMFSFNFVLMLLMICFPTVVASAFTSDPELIATVEHVLPLFLAGMTIFGLQRACQNMFVALGQARISIFIALLRKVILLVPLALVLPRFCGVEGVSEQDAKIAGIAHDRGRGLIIAVNKWDAIEKDNHTVKEYTKKVRDILSFVPYAEIIFISALTGQRTKKIFDLLETVIENHAMRIQTGVLNEILMEAVALQQPPSDKGKRLKLFYMTQVSTKPPTFVLFVNKKELMHFSYQRYIENRIRDTFGFMGTPIRIFIRERKEKE